MGTRKKAALYSAFRKFNPYHDSLGRFSTANGAASFTYAPGKSKAHDKAIATAKIQSNPYRYHTDEKLKSEWNALTEESKRAQRRASMEPSTKKLRQIVTNAKKKVKELDVKIGQVEEMMEYSKKYGNDNLF